MAKIRSTTELIYEARDKKQGIIQLEVASWSFNPNTQTYTAVVQDFLITQNEDVESKTLVNQKNVIYPSESIDQLFQSLGKEVSLNRPYSEQMDELITDALLYVTVVAPPYNSNDNDWIKC